MLLLKEKLESLQTLEAQNAHFLQNAIPNALVPFFHTLNPILQQYNVKIAYFGLEKIHFICFLEAKTLCKP